MASVQLRLDLGQTPETPPTPDPVEGVWHALDDKAREDLVGQLAALMATALGEKEGHDE